MIFLNDIELCFWKPNSEVPPGATRGVLYLLRRDLVQLYGPEEITAAADHKAPMLACIGMMTGFELMGKLSRNKLDSNRGVFLEFMKDYAALSQEHAESAWKLRCAQSHAYCLVDVEKTVRYEYSLSDSGDPQDDAFTVGAARILEEKNTVSVSVNFWALRALFLRCLQTFEERIREAPASSPLLQNFMPAMKTIGKVEVA